MYIHLYDNDKESVLQRIAPSAFSSSHTSPGLLTPKIPCPLILRLPKLMLLPPVLPLSPAGPIWRGPSPPMLLVRLRALNEAGLDEVTVPSMLALAGLLKSIIASALFCNDDMC